MNTTNSNRYEVRVSRHNRVNQTWDAQSIQEFNNIEDAEEAYDEAEEAYDEARTGVKTIKRMINVETGEVLKDSLTYNIYFNNDNNANDEGVALTFDRCIDYINQNNGTNDSYFGDYKGGTVSVVCNETGEEVYSEVVI